jgi:hypothetical protein
MSEQNKENIENTAQIEQGKEWQDMADEYKAEHPDAIEDVGTAEAMAYAESSDRNIALKAKQVARGLVEDMGHPNATIPGESYIDSEVFDDDQQDILARASNENLNRKNGEVSADDVRKLAEFHKEWAADKAEHARVSYEAVQEFLADLNRI